MRLVLLVSDCLLPSQSLRRCLCRTSHHHHLNCCATRPTLTFPTFHSLLQLVHFSSTDICASQQPHRPQKQSPHPSIPIHPCLHNHGRQHSTVSSPPAPGTTLCRQLPVLHHQGARMLRHTLQRRHDQTQRVPLRLRRWHCTLTWRVLPV